MEYLVYAVFLLGHPAERFIGKRYRHRVLGLHLLVLDVERLPVGGGMDLVPTKRLHVAIPQPCKAGEQEGLLHDVIPARSIDKGLQFLDGKELAHGDLLLRFLLCFESLERVARYQTLNDGLVQSRRNPVHHQSGRGVAQSLLVLVELASLQESDESTAERPVYVRKEQIRLPDGFQVFVHTGLCIPLASRTGR